MFLVYSFYNCHIDVFWEFWKAKGNIDITATKKKTKSHPDDIGEKTKIEIHNSVIAILCSQKHGAVMTFKHTTRAKIFFEKLFFEEKKINITILLFNFFLPFEKQTTPTLMLF